VDLVWTAVVVCTAVELTAGGIVPAVVFLFREAVLAVEEGAGAPTLLVIVAAVAIEEDLLAGPLVVCCWLRVLINTGVVLEDELEVAVVDVADWMLFVPGGRVVDTPLVYSKSISLSLSSA